MPELTQEKGNSIYFGGMANWGIQRTDNLILGIQCIRCYITHNMKKIETHFSTDKFVFENIC